MKFELLNCEIRFKESDADAFITRKLDGYMILPRGNLLTELAAALQWQPIKTAPRNTTVLVWDKSTGECEKAFFSITSSKWEFEGILADKRPEGPLATHWMPLPRPPK